MITVNAIDTSGLREKMNSLHDALLGAGQDVSTVVIDEARRLSRTIVNFIPPLRSKWGVAKKSGEMAIRRELSSLFSEAKPSLIDEIGSLHGTRNISTFITDRNGAKQQLLWDQIDPLGSRIRQLHHDARGARGKVKLHRRNGWPQMWSARVIVPQGMREPYIQRVQTQVGKSKACFAKAAALLQDSFPAWITRHFGNLGNESIADISHARDPKHPSVTFGSRAPGVSGLRNKIQAAVRFREKVIGRRLKLILSNYRGDFARGLKAAAKARRTSTEPVEAVE